MDFSRKQRNLIAEFQNLPKDRSRSKIRPPRSLNELLESSFAYYNIGKKTTQDCIMENWKEILGPKFSNRSCPQTVIHGTTLVITSHNPVIRNELEFDKARIFKRIRAIPGCEHLTGIIIRAA